MATFFICGDIVNKYSISQFITKPLINIIKNADYSICNFEGTLLQENSNSSTGVFQKYSTLKYLKDAGFDMLLLANNHITDKGKEDLKFTIDEAKKQSLNYIGAGFSFEEIYRAQVIYIGQLKFGIINICEAQVGQYIHNGQEYGYAWLGHKCIEKLISNTKKNVDFLLIFVHAGLEHYDLPLLEFRMLYRSFCDLGADCIIGTHPHIAQGIEKYNDKYIFYSLGNFFFPRSPESSYDNIENQSYSLTIEFQTDKINYYPIYHFINNLKVHLTTPDRSMIQIEKLNSSLNEPNYSILVEEVYNKAFDQLCKKLYIMALMGTEANDSFISTLKFITKYVFFRKKYWKKSQLHRNMLLLRLLQNETYQYLAQHVLTTRISNDQSNKINSLEVN